MSAQPSRYLSTYIDDHLSGATVALNRVRRSSRTFAGTPAGDVLAPIAEQLDDEREFLVATAERLGVHVSRYKLAGAWVAERVGRLKPNGHVRGPSPLSALLEVELLRGGVTAKASLWDALDELADAGVEGIDRTRVAVFRRQADEQVASLTALAARLRRPVLGGRD